MVNDLVQTIVILSALFIFKVVNNKCTKNTNTDASHYYLHCCSNASEPYQPFIITAEVYSIAVYQPNPMCDAVSKNAARFHKDIEHHQSDEYFSGGEFYTIDKHDAVSAHY